jgi:hypothetical protein
MAPGLHCSGQRACSSCHSSLVTYGGNGSLLQTTMLRHRWIQAKYAGTIPFDLLHITIRGPENLLKVREKPNESDASTVNLWLPEDEDPHDLFSRSLLDVYHLLPMALCVSVIGIVRFLSITSTRARQIVYHGTQRCPVSDFFFRSHSNTTTAKTLDTSSLTSFFDHTTPLGLQNH